MSHSAPQKTTFDATETDPSTALVIALAEARGVEPADLFAGRDTTIADYVDLEALDMLLCRRDDRRVTITTMIDGHCVRIRNTGVIEIEIN